jgi:hypothetical protein
MEFEEMGLQIRRAQPALINITVTITNPEPARIRAMSKRRRKIARIKRIRDAIEKAGFQFAGRRYDAALVDDIMVVMSNTINTMIPKYEIKWVKPGTTQMLGGNV